MGGSENPEIYSNSLEFNQHLGNAISQTGCAGRRQGIKNFQGSNAIGYGYKSARYKATAVPDYFLMHLSWFETKPQFPGRLLLLETAESDRMK